ncbi:MAG TPA: 3-deoxy-7-phosphoheptulonate synthase [Steroidobacteraceae bacterium]|jgi:3-deoxy-7-phosphoheptulonate synthase
MDSSHRAPEPLADSAPPLDKTGPTDDERVKALRPLPPPEQLVHSMPIRGTEIETLVSATRRRIQRLLRGEDDRLLVVIGPCSIHDPIAAMDYARRLAALRAQHAQTLEIIMRVYFEKPRTTIGWKGLINDPGLDGSFRIEQGLHIARELLVQINRAGVPAGGEFLDVISPQYIGDLISWGAIGARTTESQVHRELASGISAPIGFKNGTDGNVRIAVDAVQAAARSHHFLGVHKNGQVAIVTTTGNADCHVILRGGTQPNYDAESVAAACRELESAGVASRVMIDCSHANSRKQYQRQLEVVSDVAAQLAGGSRRIFGVMIESHLHAGSQAFTAGRDDPSTLSYGRSITDACVGWDDSVVALATLADAVQAGRASPRL